MNPDELLTFEDAGKLIGISGKTVGKWVASGELKSCRMPGSSRRRVRRGTFLEFVQSLEEDSRSFRTSGTFRSES